MSNPTNHQYADKTREQFDESAYFWKLDILYMDLAAAKGKSLSKTEKLHLRGLLSGYSPTEIAKKLYKSARGTESDLCSTIYHYVKILVNKEQQKVENWRSISEWLENAGYKTAIESKPVTDEKKSVEIPVDALNGLIKINRIHNNTDRGVVFEINIRVMAAVPATDENNNK